MNGTRAETIRFSIIIAGTRQNIRARTHPEFVNFHSPTFLSPTVPKLPNPLSISWTPRPTDSNSPRNGSVTTSSRKKTSHTEFLPMLSKAKTLWLPSKFTPPSTVTSEDSATALPAWVFIHIFWLMIDQAEFKKSPDDLKTTKFIVIFDSLREAKIVS